MDLTKPNNRKPRKSTPLDVSSLFYGHTPPQDLEAETAVLGAILLEKDAFDIASELISTEFLYSDAHQRIHHAMCTIRQRSHPIDMVTVISELGLHGNLDAIGGAYYVTKLTNSVVSSANIRTHCQIIKKKYILREVLRVCIETIGDVNLGETDAEEVFSGLERRVSDVSNVVAGGTEFHHIGDSLVGVVQDMEKMSQMSSDLTGISSGIASIDKITHGWQPEDLIIVAARPSVGKTAFALTNALAEKKQRRKGVISLEMSSRQLAQRMLAAESGTPLDKIKTGKMGENEMVRQHNMRRFYNHGIQPLAGSQIYVYDGSDSTWSKIRSVCRAMKRKHNVEEILIDYLQLMQGDRSFDKKGGNREQEISTITRELKNLARELRIPFIVLSQLSRAVEARANPRPQLSDLRESGAIEQDADIVLFLWKPDEAEIAANAELKNFRHYSIAKHRNGDLDVGGLGWYPAIQVMQDISAPVPAYYAESSMGGFRPIGTTINVLDPEKDDTPF